MAEEVTAALDLDKIGEATDDAEIQAELNKVRQQPPVTEAATGEVVEEAKPDVEAKPAEEVKPAEAVVEAKPADEVKPEVEVKTRDDKAWKRVRLLEDKEKRLEAELAELRKKPDEAAAKGTPDFSDDPAEHLLAKTNQLEAEVNRLKNEKFVTDRLNNIRSQEAEFKVVKPDYEKALNYLETSEVKDWMTSGASNVGINRLASFVAAGKRGDKAFVGYAEHVGKVAQRREIQELAEKEDRSPEDVALFIVARDTYLNDRRELVRQGAEATGRNPAEIAYDLALARGYTSAQATAAATAAVDDGAAAKESVTRAKLISEASNSLSESSSADTGAQPRVLRNRNEVLTLPDDMLDKLIESGSYKNL